MPPVGRSAAAAYALRGDDRPPLQLPTLVVGAGVGFPDNGDLLLVSNKHHRLFSQAAGDGAETDGPP